MPLISPPSQWRQLPRIAAKPAAYPGLVRLINFRDRSGRCLITGTGPSSVPSSGISWVPEGLWVDAVTGGSAWTIDSGVASLPVTIIIGWKRYSGTVQWSWLKDDGWTGIYSDLETGVVSTEATSFDGSVDPAGGYRSDTMISYAAITMSGANDLRMSRDGGAVAQDTSCNAPSMGAVNYIRIGSDSFGANLANVVVSHIAMLNRSVSNAELQLLSSERAWSVLFAPMPRRIWVPSAGSAVPSITAVYADSVTASSVVPRVTLDFA